jgi:hypothetical protein
LPSLSVIGASPVSVFIVRIDTQMGPDLLCFTGACHIDTDAAKDDFRSQYGQLNKARLGRSATGDGKAADPAAASLQGIESVGQSEGHSSSREGLWDVQAIECAISSEPGEGLRRLALEIS